MWITVTNQATGDRITNASFPWMVWSNGGNGQYWVEIGLNSTFSCTATDYNTYWGNTDGYEQLWIALTHKRPPPPPPPNGGGGWA